MSVLRTTPVRPDAFDKISGKTVFAFDLVVPGMIHGRLLRSPVPAGRITLLDTRRARSLPGVRAVITAADVPEVRAGWALADSTLFARDVVCYVGEPVAAVAADTPEIAAAALEAIELRIDEIAPVTTTGEALAPGARPVHADVGTFVSQFGLPLVCEGNLVTEALVNDPGVDEAFAAAAHVVEDRLVTQRQYQGYLETRNALAMATEAGIDVHVGHQYPYNLRERMAQFLDMPQDRIRIIGYPIGGAFGGKLDYGPEPYAAALALATQRPVKVVFGRGEDIATAGVRENTEILIRSALDAAGNVLARDVDMVMDNGASSGELVLLTSLVALFGAGNYRTGPVRARARLVYTNTPPTGAMRGVTGVPLVTALEKHVDHICHVLERDRREYRLEQLGGDGFRLPTGQVLHDAGILRKAFDALEERVPWHAALARRAAGPLRGIGLAATAWIVNSLPGSASVRVMADGRIELTTGANDNGSGSLATGVRQILAEEFGVAHRDIDINLPDTRDNLYDGGSQGSRTTQVAGEAARLAARVVREKIARIAAPSLGAAATDLQFVDGRIVNPRDPARAMCFVDAVQLAIQQGEDLSGRGDYALAPVVCGPSNTSGVFIPAMTCPTYHVHYCEVEVDPVTGNVRVLRYVVCQEVGTAINPREIRGQIQGGVTQGIGYALYESLALREGRYVERSLEAYRMPLAIDIPTVEVILLEHPTKEGPFGAKGIAEPPIAPAPVAILNAVADAVGEAFDRLPITPEDVLAALERRELAQSGTPRQR